MVGIRRSKLWLCAGVLTAIVVGLLAVACGGSTGPERTVRDMLAAMSAKDIDAFIAIMDPEGLRQYEAVGMSEEEFKVTLAGFDYDSMEWSGVKMETVVSEDGQTATVTIVEGVLKTVVDGQSFTQDIKESEPQVFQLVLRDGKWYLDITNMM